MMASSAAFAQDDNSNEFVVRKFNNATELTNCQVVFIDRNSNEFDAANI